MQFTNVEKTVSMAQRSLRKQKQQEQEQSEQHTEAKETKPVSGAVAGLTESSPAREKIAHYLHTLNYTQYSSTEASPVAGHLLTSQPNTPDGKEQGRSSLLESNGSNHNSSSIIISSSSSNSSSISSSSSSSDGPHSITHTATPTTTHSKSTPEKERELFSPSSDNSSGSGSGSRLDCPTSKTLTLADTPPTLRPSQGTLPWGRVSCAQAARAGHLDELKWMRNQSIPQHPWDEKVCAFAADGGHLAVLEVRMRTPKEDISLSL
jgi:hypothetical protein